MSSSMIFETGIVSMKCWPSITRNHMKCIVYWSVWFPA